jgi:hypothetical protein
LSFAFDMIVGIDIDSSNMIEIASSFLLIILYKFVYYYIYIFLKKMFLAVKCNTF